MALSTLHDTCNSATNGADPGTTAATMAVAAGDLIVMVDQTDDPTAPTSVLRNNASSSSITTEDETITNVADGTHVLADGTTPSGSIPYDAHVSVSGSSSYIWSARSVSLTGTPAIEPKTTWGGTPTGSSRRITGITATPGSGDVVPSRAGRVLATGSISGWTTSAGDRTLTLTGAISGPCMLVVAVNCGTSTIDVQVDADNDGAFELQSGGGSEVQNSSANHVLVGFYDSATAHKVGNTIVLRPTGGTALWGSGNSAVAVVYAMAAPSNDAVVVAETIPHFTESLTEASKGTAAIAETIPHFTEAIAMVNGVPAAHVAAAETIPHFTELVAARNDPAAAIAETIPHFTESLPMFSAGYIVTSSAEFTLTDPPRYTFTTALTASAIINGWDSGDLRLTVKQNGSVIKVGSWTALSTSPTVVTTTLDTPVIDGAGFSFFWEARTLTTIAPTVSDVELISGTSALIPHFGEVLTGGSKNVGSLAETIPHFRQALSSVASITSTGNILAIVAPDEVPTGAVVRLWAQLINGSGVAPFDSAPIAWIWTVNAAGSRVTEVNPTAMTALGSAYYLDWSPTVNGAFIVQVSGLQGAIAFLSAQAVTARPKFDPIALALTGDLVARM